MSSEPPKTYWESRVAKAKRDGTWDKPPPQDPSLPKGVIGSTAAQSFWWAVSFATLGVPSVGLRAWNLLDRANPIDWVQLALSSIWIVFAVASWRSWRILRVHEAEHGVLEGQELSDRRAKTVALAVLALMAALTVTLVVLTLVGVW